MYNLTSQHIEIFLTVANCGNITSAAKPLFMSQPTVSIWLGKMEESLGVQLFERKNRGVELTTEGERLYAELDPIYNRYRISLNKVLNGESTGTKQVLSIGCLRQLDMIEIMHEACYRFQNSHPDVIMMHEIYNYHECREKLLCRELDAVFTLSFEIDDKYGLYSSWMGEIKQFFVVPHSWQISDGKSLDYSALNGRNLLLEVNQGSKIFGAICDLYGINPIIKYVEPSLLLLHEVTEGDGFTISNRNLPLGRRGLLDFIPVRELPPELQINGAIAWRKDDRSQLLSDFVSICNDISEEQIC